MADGNQEVVLVRHGETAWSLSGQHTGVTDIPLTENGRQMALRVREALRGRRFSAVLTSPLARARETCWLAGFAAAAVARDDLMEWNYGEYEGLTSAEIHARRPDWSLWRDGCPGGETAAQVGARADRVIAEVSAADGPVLVFAHGHLLRVFAARWVGLSPEHGCILTLSTGALSTIGYERAQRAILHWNHEPLAASI